MRLFSKKTRSEIIVGKTKQILHDLLISGFDNNEISVILYDLSKEGKSVLQERKKDLEAELVLTTNAINRL